MEKIVKTDEEWKKQLSQEAYGVLRRHGTELPFTGKLLHNKKTGVYYCAACGNELFDSKTKFDSGSGWPSFFDAKKGAIELKEDKTLGAVSVEVSCARCGSHLGHVFSDGPKPTGKRYCVNSVALDFNEK